LLRGLGYWNYGYGHFVLLAETVLQATGGHVNLFDCLRPRGRPGSAGRSRWPQAEPRLCGLPITARPSSRMLWYLSRTLDTPMGRVDYDPISPDGGLTEPLIYSFPNTVSKKSPPSQAAGLPVRTWFAGNGILIARPAPNTACRMAVALKGGHNDEHHNHNDLGSYVVAIDGRLLLADPAQRSTRPGPSARTDT